MGRPRKADALTAAEMAARAGITVPSLVRARTRGVAPEPDFYDGRSPRWHVRTVDEWLRTRVARNNPLNVTVTLPPKPRRNNTLRSFPVGQLEIAERLGVAPATARYWSEHDMLPEPRWTVSGRPAWDWVDIEEWARLTRRLLK